MASKIKEITDKWFIKSLLRPFYLPILHWVKYKRANKTFLKHGDNVLALANKAFEEAGVFYWLEFGTLLGVYRDGRLIEHDTDIDVGVFIDQHKPALEESLLKYGFKKKKEFLVEDGLIGKEQTFELNKISLDIFYFTKTDVGMHCHLFPFDEKGERIVRQINTQVNTFKSMEWQNLKVNIPIDTDQRLKDTYGNYKIKIKDWYTPDAALNSEIINKEIRLINY